MRPDRAGRALPPERHVDGRRTRCPNRRSRRGPRRRHPREVGDARVHRAPPPRGAHRGGSIGLGAAKAHAGRPRRFAEAVVAARRLPTMLGLAAPSRNLLRSLRSLRSNSRDESDKRRALRARATSPALLGASAARHVLPARAFAATPRTRATSPVTPPTRRSRDATPTLPPTSLSCGRLAAMSLRRATSEGRSPRRQRCFREPHRWCLAAGGARRGRFPGRGAAQGRARRAQRASSSDSSRLSERSRSSKRTKRVPRREPGPSSALQSERSADRPGMSPRRASPAASREASIRGLWRLGKRSPRQVMPPSP